MSITSPIHATLCTDRVEVNFHSDLTRIIRETRYLDRMGFAMPEIALNVALQEDKYLAWLEGLESLLEHYYEVRGQPGVGWEWVLL